jgi:hypothetical protein
MDDEISQPQMQKYKPSKTERISTSHTTSNPHCMLRRGKTNDHDPRDSKEQIRKTVVNMNTCIDNIKKILHGPV